MNSDIVGRRWAARDGALGCFGAWLVLDVRWLLARRVEFGSSELRLGAGKFVGAQRGRVLNVIAIGLGGFFYVYRGFMSSLMRSVWAVESVVESIVYPTIDCM